jgi:membrane-associated phospholipid phosphatase
MAFALVYTAEHYVVDILLGWVLAAVVLLVIRRYESRRHRMVDAENWLNSVPPRRHSGLLMPTVEP